MFITVEGIEGSGKSTQVRRLADSLRSSGTVVRITREPGGTRLGERIRELLLHESVSISRRAELYLILADRAEHVESVIRPALDRGEVVLSDRFAESTLAYQAYGRGLPLESVRAAETAARDGLRPDLTFVLDCPVEVGLERTRRRRGEGAADRFESEDRAFHERVRKGFLELARIDPPRIVVIDSTRSEEIVAGEILAESRRRLSR